MVQSILKETITKNFPSDLGIRLVDMIKDPELIIKKIQQNIEKSKIICFKCHEFVSFKFTDKFYSFRCSCGMHLFYPQRSDRSYAYGYTHVLKKDFNRGVKNGNNRKFGKNAKRKI